MAARCPMCTVELEDVNAVRRHTLVEHGLSTAPEAGGWTPVSGPPGEPGWHPDPWNTSSLRCSRRLPGWRSGWPPCRPVGPSKPAPSDPVHPTVAIVGAA
jgi:hypothetical protein